MEKMLAIDISVWNENIDWDKVKANGVKAVIVRAGSSTRIDSYAKQNIERALENGLHVGAYWAMYPFNEHEAFIESETFADFMEEYKGKIDLPLFADFEYFSDEEANKNDIYFDIATRTKLVKTFLQNLQNRGWYVGNYANVDYLENKFNYDELKDFDIWLADWRDEPSEYWTNKAGIHQYSESGMKFGDGIDTTDMNYVYKDYPSIIRNAGLNGYNAQKNDKKSEWIKDKVGWWYRHADGTYTKNAWEKINNKWYYFNEKGYIKTGWVKYKDKWYYLDSKNGDMISNEFRQIDDKWYKFDENGKMLEEAFLKVNKNGQIEEIKF